METYCWGEGDVDDPGWSRLYETLKSVDRCFWSALLWDLTHLKEKSVVWVEPMLCVLGDPKFLRKRPYCWKKISSFGWQFFAFLFYECSVALNSNPWTLLYNIIYVPVNTVLDLLFFFEEHKTWSSELSQTTNELELGLVSQFACTLQSAMINFCMGKWKSIQVEGLYYNTSEDISYAAPAYFKF